jgi:predicted RNA binding protein YcfA (HicA-like mRNA interferase family)
MLSSWTSSAFSAWPSAHDQAALPERRRPGHGTGRLGFLVDRIRGSHHFLRHPDGRATVVPVHAGETIGPGLMHKVLQDCELTREDVESLL